MKKEAYKKDTSIKKAKALKKGDKVAIVSLSSGMLGEEFCSHNIEIGGKRLKEFGLEPVFMKNALKGIDYLKEHPQARAEDLKEAFQDDSIKGIICAIGGDDTYRLLPYLMEDTEFIELVQKKPKLFTGFSDTTINHLMFYKLGLATYYGPCFICDLGEIANDMLPYTKKAFQGYFAGKEPKEIVSSEIWYEEREDFSRNAVGTERIAHKEERGFELLQGNGSFQGRLLGGCAESLYDILSQNRYQDEKEICERYGVFPTKEEWKDKILFIETCEEKPAPEMLKEELTLLKQQGVFENVSGVLVGKPQDEAYYEEYKQVYLEVVDNKELPILYNVNFGHALPRCVIPYGVEVRVEIEQKKIMFLESMFAEEREYLIREMYQSEYPLLEDFLYEAIFQPDETNLAPRSILEKPELQVYIRNFGREKDDYCLCAEIENKIAGAVWVRNIKGYGSIDDVTPEFAISLYKEYRGMGIGTEMMEKMLEHLKQKGYSQTSLAVQKENYAVKMYLKVGFQIVDENDEEYIMVYEL